MFQLAIYCRRTLNTIPPRGCGTRRAGLSRPLALPGRPAHRNPSEFARGAFTAALRTREAAL